MWLHCKALNPCAALSSSAQDNWGSDALMMAAAQGHADAVQLLLRYGANPNARDCQARSWGPGREAPGAV